MADNNDWYMERDPKPGLYFWIFRHMAMGAVYAALVLFGLIAVILIFRALSFLLPEDPFAALEMGTRALNAVI
ncbi:MAG: RC-LH1 core complex protein PufX [Pseudomonadota bacterium]